MRRSSSVDLHALEPRRLLASIVGTVFRDDNINGLRDPGEPPVAGRAVYLDFDNDHFPDAGEPFVVSGADGGYAFTGLAAGTYGLWSNVPLTWNETTPRSRTVTVTANQSSTGNDFGSVPRSSVGRISGFVFDDTNGNGARDTGEPSLVRGRTVFLDANENGALDAGERQMTTQVDGYWFDNLLPGRYVVRLVVPAGLRQTAPASGASWTFNVTGGGTYSGDFGLAPLPHPFTLWAAADATVRDGTRAATNFGSDPALVVGQPPLGSSDSRAETVFKFDLSGVTTFTTAKVRVFGALSGAGQGLGVNAYGGTDTTWSEAAITWNGRPSATTRLGGATVSGTEGRWYEWDVGDFLRQRKAAGATAVTIALRPSSTGPNAVFRSDESDDPALRPRIDFDPGPLVRDVIVSGTRWSSSFLTYLRTHGYTPVSRDIGFGLPQPTSPAPAPLPWGNIDRIRMHFAEDVVVTAGDLRVAGVNVPQYAVARFDYDRSSLTATWTLAQPIRADQLTLELSPTVTTAAGNPIGGEGFRYALSVLPGDVNRDGCVTAADFFEVRSRLFRSTLSPGAGVEGYDVFHDLNGDGRISAVDLANARVPSTLPALPATHRSVYALLNPSNDEW